MDWRIPFLIICGMIAAVLLVFQCLDYLEQRQRNQQPPDTLEVLGYKPVTSIMPICKDNVICYSIGSGAYRSIGCVKDEELTEKYCENLRYTEFAIY